MPRGSDGEAGTPKYYLSSFSLACSSSTVAGAGHGMLPQSVRRRNKRESSRRIQFMRQGFQRWLDTRIDAFIALLSAIHGPSVNLFVLTGRFTKAFQRIVQLHIPPINGVQWGASAASTINAVSLPHAIFSPMFIMSALIRSRCDKGIVS